VIRFKPHVGNVKTSQATSGFTVINPYNNYSDKIIIRLFDYAFILGNRYFLGMTIL
jgi:hypothetical protein